MWNNFKWLQNEMKKNVAKNVWIPNLISTGIVNWLAVRFLPENLDSSVSLWDKKYSNILRLFQLHYWVVVDEAWDH